MFDISPWKRRWARRAAVGAINAFREAAERDFAKNRMEETRTTTLNVAGAEQTARYWEDTLCRSGKDILSVRRSGLSMTWKLITDDHRTVRQNDRVDKIEITITRPPLKPLPRAPR